MKNRSLSYENVGSIDLADILAQAANIGVQGIVYPGTIDGYGPALFHEVGHVAGLYHRDYILNGKNKNPGNDPHAIMIGIIIISRYPTEANEINANEQLKLKAYNLPVWNER